ncbi:hypothetical protein JW935_19255, partial [candidate division KSB1 bacterium]|nr:hypothetical protein [candidate division KSB1 bacterium]
MISLRHIRTVAYYEMKTLWRSWFFRIFAGIAVAVLTFANIAFFTTAFETTPWIFRGLSSFIPYKNLVLLNIIQAVIAIYLASDFLRRDKKLNTTEVIYMRSLSNGDYVFGKTLGLITIFLLLNLVILGIAAIINGVFSDVAFHPAAYLYYLLLITLPTVIFITGLAYVLMIIFRNQAVSSIILLGYFGICLFFLKDKLYTMFDSLAFYLPLVYSDFVGFSHLNLLLLQRGMYVLIGLSFICLTVLKLRRLPQSPVLHKSALVLAILSFIAAVFLGFSYFNIYNAGRSLRADINALNSAMADKPAVTINSCRLDLTHNGQKLEVTAVLTFQNNTKETIQDYVFNLNPGFRIQKIDRKGETLTFEQNLHIFTVKPESPIPPGGVDSLQIFYSGTVNEQACYASTEDDRRNGLYRLWIYKAERRYSFVESDYVLLTRADMWYPAAGIPFGSEFPKAAKQDFIRFELDVNTSPGLVAVSQGAVEKKNNGVYHFKPEEPLSQISLAVGNYKLDSLTVEGIHYQLFTLQEHNYYKKSFDQVGDTLAAIIKSSWQDFENRLGLTYPFKRLSIVEVPVHFYAQKRLWSSTTEVMQPEQVLVGENGLLSNEMDFEGMARRRERWQRRSNQTQTEMEAQAVMFERFINGVFLSRGFRFFDDDLMSNPPEYTILGNYYTFTNYLYSERWPVLNAVCESFLSNQSESGGPGRRRFIESISDEEKACIALGKTTFPDIINDPEQFDIAPTVIKVKSGYLFGLIQTRVGKDAFLNFFNRFLLDNRHKQIDAQKFLTAITDRFKINLDEELKTWYAETKIPGFLISPVEAYKFVDADRTRFQVLVKVANTEQIDGLIGFTFRSGDRMRFRPGGEGDEDEEYLYLIPANTSVELGFVLDSPPRGYQIDTKLSQNLPSMMMNRLEDLEEKRRVNPIEGKQILDEMYSLEVPGELIVDDKDEGFSVDYQPTTSPVRRLLGIDSSQDDEEYLGAFWWRRPDRWRPVIWNSAFGRYIHSAYVIKTGDGNKKVSWNAQLDESGQYDVYFHVPELRMPWGRGRERETMVD